MKSCDIGFVRRSSSVSRFFCNREADGILTLPARLYFDSLAIGDMPRPTSRDEMLKRLKDLVANGEFIVGAGAGKKTDQSPIFTFDDTGDAERLY